MNRKRTSVFLIVLFLIVFFPVGLYLFFKRITEDKSEAIRYSKIFKGFGWTGIIITLMLLYPVFGDGTKEELQESLATNLCCFGILIVLNVWFIRFGRKMKESGQRYILYNSMIHNNRRNLDEITAAANIPKEAVVKELQDLIKEGYFQGVFIDNGVNEVLLPESANALLQKAPIHSQPVEKDTLNTSQEIKAITCPNCGAKNECKEGTTTECEYCGSPISCE